MTTAAQTRPTPGARLAALVRDGARLDRTQSDPVVALRNAVGVAAPLAIGAAAGNAALGLAATIGALQTAFADRPGPYLLRTLRMLGVGLAAATTSALAVVFSEHEAASVALLFVLALGAGLLLTAGPSATQFGIASTAAALVLGHLPQPPSAALHVGLLVVLGGVGQTVLAVAAWPLRRHRPERDALAAVYRALATAARQQAGSTVGPPAGDPVDAARTMLYGLGHDYGPSVEAYRVLLDEADRVRRELLVLTASVERLAGQGNPILAGLVRGALTAAGDLLDEIAAALHDGRPVAGEVLDRVRATVRHTASRLEDSVDAPGGPTRRATAARLAALSGQLRAAVDSTGTGAREGRSPEPSGPVASPLRAPIAVLRANLAPDAAVLRHAIRLAVVVTGSDIAVRALDLSRGYWVALTLLVVMRPDFGATLQRAVMRTAGTVVGLLLATALVHWVPGGDWWHVALIALFAFGMRVAGPMNVGPTAVSLSALVVVLLAVQGVPPRDTLVERAVATLVGGALAVLAAVAFPKWERDLVPVRLAALLRAYREYLEAVVTPLDERGADRARLQDRRAACRRARTNAQASVDRAAAEPVTGQGPVQLGRAVLTHTHRFVHAVLTVDAVRKPARVAGGLVALQPFAADVATTLEGVETAVRTGAPPGPLPRLRPRQEALAAWLAGDPDAVGGAPVATVLAEATDRMTDSLDTLVDELRRQLRDVGSRVPDGPAVRPG